MQKKRDFRICNIEMSMPFQRVAVASNLRKMAIPNMKLKQYLLLHDHGPHRCPPTSRRHWTDIVPAA